MTFEQFVNDMNEFVESIADQVDEGIVNIEVYDLHEEKTDGIIYHLVDFNTKIDQVTQKFDLEISDDDIKEYYGEDSDEALKFLKEISNSDEYVVEIYNTVPVSGEGTYDVEVSYILKWWYEANKIYGKAL